MLRLLLVLLLIVLVVPPVLLVMIPVTWVVRDIRPMYAVARVVVRMIIGAGGVRIERAGIDPWSVPQPCLYVANHVSNVDPPIVWACLPRVAIMAKEVVFRWPLLGHALKLADFIPVRREEKNSRRQALEAGIEGLRRGISLLIFPEGTRSRDGALLPFRPGPFTMAIETQSPIVPITLVGAREIMPRGQAAIRPGRVQVIFHPPISTAGLAVEDRGALIERVREAIASALPQPEPASSRS